MVKLDIYQKVFVLILSIMAIIRFYYGRHWLKTKHKISINPILERLNSYLVGFGMMYLPLIDIFFFHF